MTENIQTTSEAFKFNNYKNTIEKNKKKKTIIQIVRKGWFGKE